MTGTPEEVLVLFATHNGELFLVEQIESILGQSYVPLRVLARDDGSTDGTLAILRGYAARFPQRFSLMEDGSPSGSAKGNFRRLLELAFMESAKYLAFADQDDIWLPQKIEREMEAMHRLEREHGEKPLLVFSDLSVVNQDLTVRSASLWQHQHIDPRNIDRLNRLLLANVVTGCTVLMNRTLAQLATRMPNTAYMHDWWIALLANLFGAAAFLEQPTVLYRQHGGNVLGAAVMRPRSNLPKWRQHHDRHTAFQFAVRQAAGLLEVHGSRMNAFQKRSIELLLRAGCGSSAFSRVSSFLSGGFASHSLRSTLGVLWYLWDMDAARSSVEAAK